MNKSAYLYWMRTRVLSPLVPQPLRERILLSDHPWIRNSNWQIRSARHGLPSRPFFIVGNPRSGTTLLRSILSNHPEVFIPPENGSLGGMIRTFAGNRHQPWKTVVTLMLEKFRGGYAFDYWKLDLDEVQSAAESLPVEERTLSSLINIIYLKYGSIYARGKTRWGDKTAGNSPALGKIYLVFPEALYIHAVRDGRDSIISNVKAGFARSYIEGAYQWKKNVRICRNFGRKLRAKDQFFEYRYEDLISKPEKTITELCHFLSLEPTETMLRYQGADTHLPDVFVVPHHQNVTKPIFQDSIGKWKTQIPKPELPSVLKIMGKELALYGYE
jgi:protein-tyrosine sulfotransferase